MTQREAVFQACADLDVRSSVATLLNASERLYGGDITYQAAVSFRCEYRKLHGIKTDCRKNGKKGQWRRDMKNDHTASLKQVKRFNHYFKLKRPSITSFLNLMGSGSEMFHSVEQVINAVADLVELRKAA
jgi:hypothetical protein